MSTGMEDAAAQKAANDAINRRKGAEDKLVGTAVLGAMISVIAAIIAAVKRSNATSYAGIDGEALQSAANWAAFSNFTLLIAGIAFVMIWVVRALRP